MKKQIFIAPKIKIGYVNRAGTYTGKLAYIIYYDNKGKLHKGASWESWRDKTIEPDEYDNQPIEGFTINKDIKRGGYDWFSKSTTKIRVHDPRGFEFEVTTQNLTAILMHTDCLRRGLIGNFVYAWEGPELVLLPTNSEEYQNALKYTANLSKKVRAKDLIPGYSYRTKREGDVIFMGKLNWFAYKEGSRYSEALGLRTEKKVFVFTNNNGKTFFNKNSVEFLAEVNSDGCVSNYAELMDKFNTKKYANKIVKHDFRPTTFDDTTKNGNWGPELIKNFYYIEHSPGVFIPCTITAKSTWQRSDWSHISENILRKYVLIGYELDKRGYYGTVGIKQETGEHIKVENDPQSPSQYSYYRYRGDLNRETIDLKDVDKLKSRKFYDLYVIFENGKEQLMKTEWELRSDS